MRKGLDGLALLVPEVMRADPFTGHLFAFREKGAGQIKLLVHDGTGLCLFVKRLDQGASTWPSKQSSVDGTVSVLLSPIQLSMLIEGWSGACRCRHGG